MRRLTTASFGLAALAVISLGGSIFVAMPALSAEVAVQAEKSPPGDIPDSQVFIPFSTPVFTIQVPEGWSRKDTPTGARFFDKFNIVYVASAAATVAPTAASVNGTEVKALVASGRAVTVANVKEVTLKGGKAVAITYSSNSEPNAVTNKQVRLEQIRYLFFKAGNLVTLDMAAPFGADNVDQWSLMANSLRFK